MKSLGRIKMFHGDIEKNQKVMEVFEKSRSIIILGTIGSGKTALAFKILSHLSQLKPVFWIAHPKPQLLDKFGYECLESVEDIECLENSIIVYDEPQLSLNISDRQRDFALARVLSLSRQRGNTLIMMTSDTRLLSPKVEAYLETWCIKDIEYAKTKQRGIARHIIQKNCLISPEGFGAKENEFLLECPDFKFNGRWTYPLIPEWSEELSKPYARQSIQDVAVADAVNQVSETSLNIQKLEKTPENSEKLLKTQKLTYI
jgi:hypothetical protein